MQAACLVAEYESQEEATIGLEVLRKNDFEPDAISVCWRGNTNALDKVDLGDASEESASVPKAAGVGAAIATAAGTPLAIMSVMGPIMIAGPIVAATGGTALGAMASQGGAHARSEHSTSDAVDSQGLYAMANYFGINSHQATEYEKRVHSGAILLIVTSTSPRLDEAQRALKTTKAVSLQRFAFRDSENEGE